MPIKDFLKPLFDSVPTHVRRLVIGGAVLGLVMMLFLKVIDEAFNLSPSTLTWVALPVTALFAFFLCSGAQAFAEKCMHLGVAAIVIFAVGFTSNNVVAGMRDNLGLDSQPQPVASLADILSRDAG